MAAIPIGLHAERKRRVSEKEVRLIDGQVLERINVPSLFSFSIGHSRPLLHPAVSVALFNAHTHAPSQGLKKQKPSDGRRGMVEQPKRREEGERED